MREMGAHFLSFYAMIPESQKAYRGGDHMEVNRIEGGYSYRAAEPAAQGGARGVLPAEGTDKDAPEGAAIAEQRKAGQEEAPMGGREQQKRMELLADTLKHHNIEISYNDEVNRYAIKVLDAESKEVVKEIPSEKSLEMFARMMELEGLLVDERR